MKHPAVQLGFAVGVLAAALIAYGAWYAFVAYQTARDASLDTTISQESDATASAALARRTLAALGPEQDATESRFISTADVVSFLQDLQAVGTREGAAVSVGSVSEDDSSPRAHLDLSLTVSGSFDGVMRTLGVIENGPYDIETQQASLSASSDGSGWDATMQLTVGTKDAAASSTPSFFGSDAGAAASPVPKGGSSAGSAAAPAPHLAS